MKTCFKCNIEKTIDQFYKHPAMKDGHVNKCISCNKKDVTKLYLIKRKNNEFVELNRERGREKYKRLNYKFRRQNKESRKKAQETYCCIYPEKRKAKAASAYLHKAESSNHLHHWSYNKDHYKDCIELSKELHYLAHRHIIYDKERMMYRTKEGILLDTKEAHIEYINKIYKESM